MYIPYLNSVKKYQNIQLLKGDSRSPPSYYEHPFTQSLCMFAGEMLCIFLFGGHVAYLWIGRKVTQKTAVVNKSGNSSGLY